MNMLEKTLGKASIRAIELYERVTGNSVEYQEDMPKMRLLKREEPTKTKVLWACLPIINQEATALTMNAYRHVVARYNTEIEAQNEIIEDKNQQIIETPTLEQKHMLKVMLGYGFFALRERFTPKGHKRVKVKLLGDTTIDQYNEKAEEFNNSFGRLLPLIPKQTIKAQSEQVFRQIIYLYSLQLNQSTQARKTIKIHTPGSVARVQINNNFVKLLKHDDIQTLNLSPKTIKRHCQRFLEAGILTDYSHLNSFQGSLYHISPEILVVFCEKLQKNMCADNHLFKAHIWTKCPHKKKCTGSIINNKKIKKENFEKFSNKETSSPQEPLQEQPQAQSPAPEQGVGGGQTSPYKPQNALNSNADPYELCRELSEGKYAKYTPIYPSVLSWEAFYGVQSREEFQQLLIAQMLKTLSGAYSKNIIYAGVWYQAHQYLTQNYFYMNKKENILHSKTKMLDLFTQMIWRLKWAVRYCKRHKDFHLLVPSLYFDHSRVSSAEGGFAYTLKAYKRHLNNINKNTELQAKRENEAILRKEKINAHKWITQQIRKTLKGNLTLERLYGLVREKFELYLKELPLMFEKERIIFMKKLADKEQKKQQEKTLKGIEVIQVDTTE